MVPLGSTAPSFNLLNTIDNEVVNLDNLKSGTATVIMFICNHCPFVKHLNSEIVNLSNEYMEKGINFIAISSNDVEYYPQDGPGEMKKMAIELGYKFPYLYDETQQVAKDYGAECTPDFFIYNEKLELVYRGQFDDSRPGKGIPNGTDIRNALDNIISKKPIDPDQKPSVGCNIKWKI